MSTIVIYHADCVDGFTAAWIAHRKLGDDDVQYIPAHYGDTIDYDMFDDCDLYVLDFSFKRQVMESLMTHVKSMVVLDHHKTAKAELEGFEHPKATIIFDQSQCGATLSWVWFFPHEPIPPFVMYVKDRDLWEWKLPSSREVSAAISSYEKTWDNWDYIMGDRYKLVMEGTTILRYQKGVVQFMADRASTIEFEGIFVPIINTTGLISEIGEELCKRHPPMAIMWFREQGGKFVYSLRSVGDFDVSMIARKYGGGGHRNAAGFTLDHLIY